MKESIARASATASIESGAERSIERTASFDISRPALLCLFIALFLVWFYTLGARTLVPSDEGRYAEIAREMAVTGDFITPRLNGIKYFGKPPLQAWINALTFRLFGFGEWQARLWTGLCSLFGIFMVFQAGRRVFNPRTGFLAALVLGSTSYWAMAAHFNSYDMSLSAMMALALCALLIAQRNEATARERRNWMLLCWCGVALAVMTKGLVGIVLPGATLALYTLASRDWSVWKRLHIGLGLMLFLVITTPWFVLVSVRNPEFLHFFFIREHFHRFTSNVHLRGEPWHYFIPLLLAGTVPWLGVLAQSLRNGARKASAGFQASRLLLVWVLFIFCFFSFSRAKLPSYILPVFPALALLIAHYLDGATRRAIVAAAGSFGLLGALALIGLGGAAATAKGQHLLVSYEAYIPWVAIASVLALIGGGLSAWLAYRQRGQRNWALIELAAASFMATQTVVLGHEALGRQKAGVDHMAAIQSELDAETPIYAVGAYEYALPFYLQRTMTLVERAEDGMRLGLQQEPHLWIPSIDMFTETWKAHHANGRNAIAIMRPDLYDSLTRGGLPMRVIARDSRRVIVASNG